MVFGIGFPGGDWVVFGIGFPGGDSVASGRGWVPWWWQAEAPPVVIYDVKQSDC